MGDKIGAAWSKTNAKGNPFTTGTFKIGGEDWNFLFASGITKNGEPYYNVNLSNGSGFNVKLSIFKNNFKMSPKHPDYVILQSTPYEGKSEPTYNSGPEDEVPF